MNDLRMIEMINSFPIGGQAKNRNELLSKAEVVAFLSRFQEQFETIENVDERETIVRKFLSDLISLAEGETLPNITMAERTLHLSPGFLQDWQKVQFIKENNPAT